MGRKTKMNKITSKETTELINKENIRLMEDFLDYLKSTGRSDSTIRQYKYDCMIFFTWLLENANNKYFVDVKKRDIVAYQNWLIKTNENSSARVRRLKSALSSLSSYIENILDDENPNFRSIIKKIESPVNQAVREKTVLTDEQCDLLLNTLVERGKYEQACLFALARYSGRRKAELTRFKTSFFKDEYIIYGSLYKTPEKIRTKGRGANGKMIYCYVLAKPFKRYLDLWMKQREDLGIESEWLFPDKYDNSKQISISTLDSWAESFSNILGVPIYLHSLRHRFATALSEAGVPATVIKEIVSWESLEMVNLYVDTDADEQIGKYFSDGEIIGHKQTALNEL